MDNENSVDSSGQSRKKSLFVRIIRLLLIVFFTLLVLIGGTAFVIVYYYQNEVKEYVVGELNKQLNTQILIDGKDIDFTVLKNFPYASVDFKNVKALDATNNKKKDTLFKAGEISLQFNIIDVFKKKYIIKKLKLDEVDLNIRVDKNGNDNYHFWKLSTDTNKADFSFALEKIILNQVQFSYKNYQTKQYIDLLIKKSNLSGQFSTDNYTLEVESDLLVDKIKLSDVTYLKQKNVHGEIVLNVDNTISSYKIKSGKIKIENLLFEVVGNIIDANNESIINLGIRSKNMDIRSVLSLIPNKYKEKINDYESEGEFYFNATIQGSVGNNKIPQITADFGIKNADITQVKNNIVLHRVNLKGHYFNGAGVTSQPSELTLIPFSALINQGFVEGELSLKNLDNPSFNAKIKANISLEELQHFWKIDTIETITGQLKMDALFTGEGKNLASGNYENIRATGNLLIADMNAKFKNNILDFRNMEGDFQFDNNDVIVNSMTGSVSNSDFEIKGSFKNIMGYVLKENEDIAVEATLHSKNIDLNELLADKHSNADNKYKLQLSEHMNVVFNADIQNLVFRKFNATDIKGIIKLKDKKIIVDPVTLSTMDGHIITTGLIDGSDSTKFVVTCFSDVSRIHVTRMFEQFENFGQTTIMDKNIKGIATAKIQFASVFTPELEINMDKLYAGVDMTIENGELINMESMKSLSKFIELKDLENIRFSTLKNQVEIKDQVITIPKMEVKSNAINIVTSGTHTFNNEINYKIKLSLNELLSKKAKKAKKENEEFGEIEDDGLGRTNIFLSMTGTVDNPIIKYDSKSAIQNVKQDIKVEKQTLKTILKEEFGLFKKDTSVADKYKKTNESESKFKIEWEENDPKINTEKKELKKPKRTPDEDF